MTKYLLSVVILLTTANAFAQTTVSGKIRDERSKEPLPGVSISFPELKTGTVSNSQGEFKIRIPNIGPHLLQVKAFGYQSIIQRIDFTNDTLMDLLMESAAIEVREVTVTGLSRAGEIKLNPVIITTVDKRLFDQNSATNLIDGLKSVPGISQISTGPNISKPVIRGLGYSRVITLLDGIRQEGQQWGDEHGIEIDEYSIDKVEIIKGPGSLIYGSDGIGGVLNFLPAQLPFTEGTNTNLTTNYQSNGQLFGYSLSNSGNKSDFQWIGRLSNKYAGNDHNPNDGSVFNSGFNELNGSLSLGVNKNWGYSDLSIRSYNTKLGIVEGERDSLGRFTFEDEQGNIRPVSDRDLKGYQIHVPYQIINHLSIASKHYFLLDKGSINAHFGFQNNQRKEFEEPDEPKEAGLHLSLNTFNYHIRYNFDKRKGWETSLGIGGMLQANRNKGSEFLIPDYHLFDGGIFLYSQKSIEKLTIAGGFRVDYRYLNTAELHLDESGRPIAVPDGNSDLKFAPSLKKDLGISGSLGLSYQASKTSTLKFNVSRGFRAPNIAEIASNGKHEGTFRYEIGSPNLKPEVSHQIDFAYSLDSDHLLLEISPFVNFISNYIFLEKLKTMNGNDSIPDPSDGSPAFQFTSGNARLMGGEIYLDWHPHPWDWLHVENSFSYVLGQQAGQTDTTKFLPFIPAPHYRGGLKVELPQPLKRVSNLYAKVYVDHYFAQNNIYSAYQTETKTAGYTLLSAGLGARFPLFGRQDFLSLFLNAENIMNTAYQTHLNRLKYAPINPSTGRRGIFDKGRNISVKLAFNL